MAGAVGDLRGAVEAVPMHPPAVPVIGNVEARPLTGVEAIREELVTQLTAPVRWTDTIRYMRHRGVRRFLEFGPGGVLRGLVRRIVSDAEAACVSDPESMAEVRQAWLDEMA
jgi:[acyl-carrier-protein] S-malonyltransferase